MIAPPLVGFAVLLALTGGMRLVEWFVSVRRMRPRPAAVVAEPWLFPAMATLHLGLVTLPLFEVLVLERPFSALSAVPALVVLGMATGLRVWTLRTLGRAWNVRVVVPEPSGVVTGGPYRFVRHPNYLVVCLEVAALPCVHGAWIAALALTAANALVLRVRIRTEERALATVPGWAVAFADKPRLIPGVF